MTSTKFLLLAGTLFTYPALAADPSNAGVGGQQREAFSCLYAEAEYSIGAIISVGDILYRCVSTFDQNLQRQMAWVKISEHGVEGTDVSIYMV